MVNEGGWTVDYVAGMIIAPNGQVFNYNLERKPIKRFGRINSELTGKIIVFHGQSYSKHESFDSAKEMLSKYVET